MQSMTKSRGQGPVATRDAALGRELQKQEQIIMECMEDFVRLGMAYKAIRDGRLYRAEGFSSFETYTKDKWDRHVDHIHKVIASATLRLSLPSPKKRSAADSAAQWTEWSVGALKRLGSTSLAKSVAKGILAEVDAGNHKLTASLVTKHVNAELGIERTSVSVPKREFEDAILQWTGDLQRMAEAIKTVPADALELFAQKNPAKAKALAKAIEMFEKSLQRVWDNI